MAPRTSGAVPPHQGDEQQREGRAESQDPKGGQEYGEEAAVVLVCVGRGARVR